MNGVLSISGTNGGSMSSNESQALMNAVRGLLGSEASLADFREIEASMPRRRAITLLANNECNLSCSHCYLQLPKPDQPRLSPPEWEALFVSAWDSGVEHFVIAGKELFLGQAGPEILARLQRLRESREGMGLGIITNGTRIHLHRDQLTPEKLSYVDLSMEGARDDHDAIRGSGSYDQVVPNVKWAAATLGEQLFVTLTIQKRNIHRLKEAILAFADLGVRNVGLSFYIPLPYTDQSLALDEADFDLFYRQLGSLGSLTLDQPMHLHVDAGTISPHSVTSFMRSEWFNLDTMEVDRAGFMYSHFRFCNGMPMSIRFVPVPISLGHASRIGVDGTLVCAEDSLKPRLYSLNQLGNVRDTGLDYGALIGRTSTHPRLRVVEQTFENELLPAIQRCYADSLGRTFSFASTIEK